MKYLYTSPLFVGAVLAIALSSCKNVVGPSTGAGIFFPDTGTISYSRYVQPLFDQTCATYDCHDQATGNNGNLDLTDQNSYFSLTGTGYINTRGDTTHCILLQAIKGQLTPRMPLPPYPRLTPNQISGITRWVAQGAKYN